MILQGPFAIPNLVFSPPRIAGLKLWLYANSLALNNNDPVATWSDLSGNGNDAAQATAGNKPLFKTNIINGLAAVLFDGTDDFMTVAVNPAAQPNTTFVVTQPTLNTASQKSYATLFHGAASSFIAARITTNFWGTFTGGTGDLSSTVALVSGTNYLLEETAATSSTFLYQQGTQKATRAETVNGPGGTAAGVGKDLINANRQYAGYIAEVIVFNTVLSSGNRVLVENYLIAKYAL